MPDLHTFLHEIDRTPMPDIWDRATGQGPKPLPPDGSRTRRAIAAAVAIVIAVAGLSFAYEMFRTQPAERVPIEAPLSLVGEARVTATIPLPDGTIGGGVAVASGSAWVGFQAEKGDAQPGVARIDLATNQIVATIPVDGTPWRDHIVATDQAVWTGSGEVIDRIDPAADAVVARIPIEGRVSAMDADASAVWVVTTPSYGADAGAELLRLDPITNEIVTSISLGDSVSGYEDQVVSSGGSVWIMGRRLLSDETERGGDLIRVDVATNSVVSRWPVGGFGVVVGDGEVWVHGPKSGVFDSSDEPWVWRTVDIDTGDVSEPFRFGSGGLTLITPDRLWSVGYDETVSHIRATSFDPQTLAILTRSETIDSPVFHDAVIDPTSRTVWISAVYDVVRMDIR
jgi:hypothetical protein